MAVKEPTCLDPDEGAAVAKKKTQTSCKMTLVSPLLYSSRISHTAEHPDETEYYTQPETIYSQLHCPSITRSSINSVPV